MSTILETSTATHSLSTIYFHAQDKNLCKLWKISTTVPESRLRSSFSAAAARHKNLRLQIG